MNVVFGHDHKFRKINGEFYSTGGLSNEVLSRYVDLFGGKLIVIARVINEDKIEVKYSKIINPNVKIININQISINRINDIVENADCIIARLPSFAGNILVSIAKKKEKSYLIELVGCPWDSLWNHSYKGKLVAPFMALATWHYVKKADYVLYVTNNFLQRRYPTKGKSIGCSDVALEDFDGLVLQKRLEHIKKHTGKIIIGTTAAVNVKYKGQEFVIKALEILKKQGNTDFEYQLVGNGNITYLKNIAEKYNVSDQVIFKGGLSHDQVFEWLDSIDVYIQPSLQEGLPRAVVEAQSRALPCYGSSTGGIPELLSSDCICNKKGNMPLAIAHWLSDLTVEKVLEYAKQNFEYAKLYQSDVLNEKRNAFYKAFKEYVEEKKL